MTDAITSAAVFIDWENVTFSFRSGSFDSLRFDKAIALQRLFNWVKSEVGSVFDTFLFTPLHLLDDDYELFRRQGIVPITCSRLPFGPDGRRVTDDPILMDEAVRDIIHNKWDRVDPILVTKALKWIRHPEITHFCLVAGDSDYIPLIEKAKERNLKIMLSALDPALAPPGHPPMSRELEKMADISPKTGQPMVYWFSPQI